MTNGLYDRMIDHRYHLLFSPWGLLGALLMAGFAALVLRERAR